MKRIYEAPIIEMIVLEEEENLLIGSDYAGGQGGSTDNPGGSMSGGNEE